MGGGSKTFNDISVAPIIDSNRYGKVYNSVIVDAGKQLPLGMRSMIDTYSLDAIKMKTLMNKPLVEHFGYENQTNITSKNISNTALIDYIKNNEDPDIDVIVATNYNYSLDIATLAMMELINNDDYDYDYPTKILTQDSREYYIFDFYEQAAAPYKVVAVGRVLYDDIVKDTIIKPYVLNTLEPVPDNTTYTFKDVTTIIQPKDYSSYDGTASVLKDWGVSTNINTSTPDNDIGTTTASTTDNGLGNTDTDVSDANNITTNISNGTTTLVDIVIATNDDDSNNNTVTDISIVDEDSNKTTVKITTTDDGTTTIDTIDGGGNTTTIQDTVDGKDRVICTTTSTDSSAVSTVTMLTWHDDDNSITYTDTTIEEHYYETIYVDFSIPADPIEVVTLDAIGLSTDVNIILDKYNGTVDNDVLKYTVANGDYLVEVTFGFLDFDVTTTYTGNFTFNVIAVPIDCDTYYDPCEELGKSATSRIHNLIASYFNNNILGYFIVYKRTDGSYKSNYYRMQNLPNSVFTHINLDVLPFIPLKQHGNIVINDKAINVIFKNYGLTGKDLKKSVSSNSELKDAYIGAGLPVSMVDPKLAKFIYLTLDSFIPDTYTSGSLATTIKADSVMGMYSNYTIDVHVKDGVKCDVGDYIVENTITTVIDVDSDTTLTADPEDGSITYVDLQSARYITQLDDNSYKEILLVKVQNTYVVGGVKSTKGKFTSENSKEIARLPLIRDVVKELSLLEYAYVIERSLELVMHSSKTVKVKWYQTTLFSFLITAITMIIAVYTGQWELFAASMTLQIVSNYLPKSVVLVLSIALAVAGGINGALEATSALDSIFITAASLTTVVSSISNYIAGNQLEHMQSNLQKQQQLTEEKQKELEELTSDEGNAVMMTPVDIETFYDKIDTYYELATGDIQYNNDLLYDYDSVYRL